MAPALVLLFFGFLLDKSALAFLLPCTKSYANEEDKRRTRRARVLGLVHDFVEFVARVCAAPMLWVVLSFLRTQYYVCAVFGPSVEAISENPHFSNLHVNATDGCGRQGMHQRARIERAERTHSQMLGCWLMVATMTVVVLLGVLRHFSGKRRQVRALDDHVYRHLEAKAALLEFHKRAKEMAEAKGRRAVGDYFSQTGQSGNYIEALSRVRELVVAKYNEYTSVPDSPTTPEPKAPEERTDGSAPTAPTASSPTAGPPQPDCENMYYESHQLTTRVTIYTREISNTQ